MRVKPYTMGKMIRLVFTLCCALILACGPFVQAAGISGRALQVLSGDRLILQGSDGKRYDVRLAGVKCPPPDQKWGVAARRYLGTLIMGRSIKLTYGQQSPGRGQLGRLWHGGSDVNIRLLQAGLAQYHPVGLSDSDQHQYAASEQRAMTSRQGLWSETGGKTGAGSRTISSGPLIRIQE